MPFRVLEGEQIKFGGKLYTEGRIVPGMSKEQGEAVPWAVKMVSAPKAKATPKPKADKPKASKKAAAKKSKK